MGLGPALAHAVLPLSGCFPAGLKKSRTLGRFQRSCHTVVKAVQFDSRQTQEFVHLLTSHQGALRAFILSQIPGSAGVADVQQQVNLLLWEKMATFELGSNFRAWAFAVARYKIKEYRRELKRDGWLLFNNDLADDLAEEVTDDESQNEWYMQALDRCLAKLGSDERELLMHRYSRSGTIKEYANQHGLRAGSLRTVLQRLRIVLRNCVVSQMESNQPSSRS